jgi:hypothetical protein
VVAAVQPGGELAVIFVDGHKTELWFTRRADGLVLFVKTEDADEIGFTVTDLPRVIREMSEAAGESAPVMLGRPDLDAMRDKDGWVRFRGLRLFRCADGSVSFAIGGNVENLPEGLARAAGAAAVALADEPGPAEVEELAHLIRLALYPGSDRIGLRPSESDKVAARAVLRAGYRRETNRG